VLGGNPFEVKFTATVQAATGSAVRTWGTAFSNLDDLSDDEYEDAMFSLAQAIGQAFAPGASPCPAAVCVVPLDLPAQCDNGFESSGSCKYTQVKAAASCNVNDCSSVDVLMQWRGGTADEPCGIDTGGSGIEYWFEREMKLVHADNKSEKWRTGRGSNKTNSCIDDHIDRSPVQTISHDHLAIFKYRHIDEQGTFSFPTRASKLVLVNER
jgi:hypothetical protein